jgi:predicted ferric reductase
LFYCVKTPSEAVFEKEILSKITNSSNISYWQFCSADRGRITAEAVFKTVGNLENKKIMLCGPVPMMTSLANQFKKMGIKGRNIIFEDFNFK